MVISAQQSLTLCLPKSPSTGPMGSGGLALQQEKLEERTEFGAPSPSKQCVDFSARLKFEFQLHYSPVMWSRVKRNFTLSGSQFPYLCNGDDACLLCD